MQCSRCSYIQFKTSSKCANCGYDFKKLKSNVHADAENTFTIFATVGAEVEAVSGNVSAETQGDFQQESPMADMNGLYDLPSDELTDHTETDVENIGDFELDLSEANGPDSASWDIGATLTGDFSESTSVAPENDLKDEDLETGDIEVQGLGFDVNADPAKPELTKEEDPEMDDFFLPEQNLDADSDEITLETELPIENTESDAEQTSQASVNFEVPELELNPTIELEELQLDLETVSLEVEPKQTDPSTAPEASFEGLELKMDSDEDTAKPLFPDEESQEEPKEDH